MRGAGALALFALACVAAWGAPVQANTRTSCTSTWKGSWELSAEGYPVAIYTFYVTKSVGSLRGNLEEYSDAQKTLDDVSLSGSVKSNPFSAFDCDGKTLVATRSVRPHETSTIRLSRDSDGGRWLEIADLPPGYVSPRYVLRPVPTGTTLPAAPSVPARLLLDQVAPKGVQSNDEMRRLFSADQDIRFEVERRGGWTAVSSDTEFMAKWRATDKARRDKTLQLLDSGQLRSGPDYYRAAFILQHGNSSDDFLLAHHLALVALSLGTDQAKWIAAASLDRFLLSVGRPQIYGTQFSGGNAAPEEPYNRNLIPVKQRRLLGVDEPIASASGTRGR